MQVAQRREVLEREADRVEQRHLAIAVAARSKTADDVGELDHREVRSELLDLAFDARLRRVLDDDPQVGTQQDVAMQFGLVGAVAADGVEVHPGSHETGRDDRRVALVGRDGGDDVGAVDRVGHARAARDAQRRQGATQVAFQLVHRVRIDVVQPQGLDAEHPMKGDGLELRLRAVADQRHRPARPARHAPCRQCRHRGRSQRGGQRQLRQQDGIAGGHVGQHAEGGHGQQAARGILRMTVDVLEGVLRSVADRHQLDHAVGAVDGVARRLVERVPASIVALDLGGDALDRFRDADLRDQCAHRFDADIVHHDS